MDYPDTVTVVFYGSRSTVNITGFAIELESGGEEKIPAFGIEDIHGLTTPPGDI